MRKHGADQQTSARKGISLDFAERDRALSRGAIEVAVGQSILADKNSVYVRTALRARLVDGCRARQPNNNCYNYATNYRTDTFRIVAGGGQPGAAAGAMYTSLTCPSVKTAAIADDLIDSPGANNTCPREGHLVALVIWPGLDFHWFRKGRNAYWSHKPGSTAVTNLDNSGVTIPDPRTADRGPYTDFCTFMVVMHGHIKVK